MIFLSSREVSKSPFSEWVGSATYHALESQFPGRIIGFERAPVSIAAHEEAERNVLLAEATDSDFRERVCPQDDLDLIVLAMPTHSANIHAAQTLRRHDFHGTVASSGKHPREINEFRSLGVDTAFNLYSHAGCNFAPHVMQVFHQQQPDLFKAWRRDSEEG